jgi:hypothetical protein
MARRDGSVVEVRRCFESRGGLLHTYDEGSPAVLAARTGRTTTFYVREAIAAHLDALGFLLLLNKAAGAFAARHPSILGPLICLSGH